MDTQEGMGWNGVFEFVVRCADGREEVAHVPNRLTNGALNAMRNALDSTSADNQLRYFAFGTSSGALADTDTALHNESDRIAIATRSTSGTGGLLSIATVPSSEMKFHIQEVGVFGGSGASTTAGSGLLISRILWECNKTTDESIDVRRTDSFTRT